MEEDSRIVGSNLKKQKYDSSFYLMTRLFKEHIKFQNKRIWFAACCMLIISLTTAVNAWLLEPMLDNIFVNKDTTMLKIVPLILMVNAFVKGAAVFFQNSIMKRIGQKIITDIQLRLYSHLIHADMKFLNEHPSGNLISRFANDINAMRKSVSDVVTGVVMDFFTLLGLVGVMYYQNHDLALISLLLIPTAFIPMLKIGRKMRKVASAIQEELGDFTIRLDETFQNISIIKSYGREEYEISRVRSVILRFLKLYKKAAYVESASSPIMEAVGGVTIAFIIWYGGSQVIEGTTTVGSFFSFIAALLMSYRPLKSISQLNTSLQEGLASSRRLFMLLDEEPTIKDDCDHDEQFDGYDINLKNIYFAYNSNLKTLNDLNMHIPHGATVALVGSSGSGKSTVFNLLQRLYEPDYGNITIGGKNIKKVGLKTLRESIALVSQEVSLFDDSIRENISYGRLGASEEEIIDAALCAAAHDFIINLPQGYDTQIGQNGLRLSGGQRQRIAIARAILKDAPILLLDEATSSLDTISEKQVQLALEFLKKGRTTVIIAHRLSTIENANIIYFMAQGKILEYGSHPELFAKKGEYYRYCEAKIHDKSAML